MTVSIGKPLRPRHRQSAPYRRHFGIGHQWRTTGDAVQWHSIDSRQRPLRLRIAWVSPDSRWSGPRQPRSCATRFRGVRPGSEVRAPRPGPEAELFPVKTACSLARRPCGTLNRPYHAVPCRQAPPAPPVSCRRIAIPWLTCKPFSSSTTGSRGPSLARSIVEQKASQSLPALQAPVLNRGGRRPRGDRPEVLFRSACAFDLRQPCGWPLLKRVKAVD